MEDTTVEIHYGKEKKPGTTDVQGRCILESPGLRKVVVTIGNCSEGWDYLPEYEFEGKGKVLLVAAKLRNCREISITTFIVFY